VLKRFSSAKACAPGAFADPMRKNFLHSLIAIAAILWGAPSHAASSVQADHVALSISLETPAKPGTIVWAAIRQTIAPGWHTYWRNPGDSGLATSVSWILPKGISAGAPLWPVPERFTDGPIVNYGYANEATLLVPLTIARDAAAGVAQAKIFLLECEHMCIPENITLDLDLHKNSPALFAAARAKIPRDFGGTQNVSVDANNLTLILRDPVLSHVDASKVHFYPATSDAVNYDVTPVLRIAGDTLTWKIARDAHARKFAAFTGVLELPGAGAFAISAKPLAPIASQRVESEGLGLVEAILLAFLGGLILNLMPCVLPILSMKALALSQSGGNLHALRRDGVFYFAGVLATFTAMGGLLLLFKSGGAALGWGFQLQSPLVTFVLALLMTAIGLNLLGVFEIPLSLAGIGDDLTRGENGRSAFFTGALAVLVASPCTAPFMGTALGFALTQPAIPALAVFLALGAGFAFPFSALAFTPALVRLIPRPGTWMLRLREFLAFPMFATAIWLIWVLSQQAGPDGVAWALSIGLGVVFLLWLLPHLGARLRWIAGSAGIAALAALSLQIHAQMPSAETGWAPWSAEAVASARAAGRPVLVDFSAAWCVTCLVNESVALDDASVVARLHRDRVVTLRGDWTNRSTAIAAELNEHGRNGVPLYLLYPPGSQAAAVVLPQLLTPALVLSALAKIENAEMVR
jgi:thiol:disulfide interchange protein/DsbC/DsbD-like thiol-disulfide interchange protein